ncbi:hypothetical protein AGMMS49942_05010 [Spirochaetia bacterium]|nr:hypothetical protein AGMMS49942_05010 [Spirochaetia bacterium]
MNNHAKKIIAPIVVTIGIALYYTIGVIVLLNVALPDIIKVTAIIVSVIVTVVFVFVLIERIKEIRSGEEDDLSQY